MTTPQKTIPSYYYTDSDYYELEKERIFYRTWQFACHVTDIPEHGSFQTIQIADESVVVLRDNDDEIRAFYNVCRHRAHRLVEGNGKRPLITCPYHAWAYGLDGKLVRAPGTKEIEGFDAQSIGLQTIRVDELCGLIFVNLDDNAENLDRLFPELRSDLVEHKPGLATMQQIHQSILPHACNWKVSVENYSECYHCQVVHKYSVSNLYSGSEYRITLKNGVVRHYTPSLKDREVHGDLHIWFLWPNFAIQLYPLYRSVSLRHFQPLGPGESQYVYTWYIDPGLNDAQRAEVMALGSSTYHSTNGIEDQNIVRNVQLGLNSRSYDRGHLVIPPIASDTSEIAVADFQKRYLEAIGESQ